MINNRCGFEEKQEARESHHKSRGNSLGISLPLRSPLPAGVKRLDWRDIMKRIVRLLLPAVLLAFGPSSPAAPAAGSAKRPNILWLIGEDFSPHLGCYGTGQVWSPNLDKLAGQGMRFTRAYTTAPVCSASRSAFITGMYQTTIGAHNHSRNEHSSNYQQRCNQKPQPGSLYHSTKATKTHDPNLDDNMLKSSKLTIPSLLISVLPKPSRCPNLVFS